MTLDTEWITYPGTNSQLRAYTARPAGAGPYPLVLVIQEIWGPDEHIQDVTRRIAENGYLALAPDLYYHDGRAEALSDERIAEAKEFLNSLPPGAWGNDSERQARMNALPAGLRQRVQETMGALFGGTRNMDAWVDDLRHALRAARQRPGMADAKAVSVGFCLGGALSALLACREPTLSGAVIFYGSSPAAEEARHITCPILGLYGEHDPAIVSGLPDFERALDAAGVPHHLEVFPGAGHAFFNDTRPSYHQAAAEDAWRQVLEFLTARLRIVA
jgi:carboxymethylenebutenolidase